MPVAFSHFVLPLCRLAVPPPDWPCLAALPSVEGLVISFVIQKSMVAIGFTT
jgi:hypothetical protein